MSVQNLVLEIAPDESAADVQTRLNRAAADGFFLVNVVGRLAFLRTTVTGRKPVRPTIFLGRDGMDPEAREIVMAHPDKSVREVVDVLTEAGIKRGRTWVSDARIAARKNSQPGEVKEDADTPGN